MKQISFGFACKMDYEELKLKQKIQYVIVFLLLPYLNHPKMSMCSTKSNMSFARPSVCFKISLCDLLYLLSAL